MNYAKKKWIKPGPMTGYPPGLLQDDDPMLSKWFASRLDARRIVRSVCEEIEMKNPIPKTGFVATPDSLEDLMEYCERFSGSEKAIAMVVATMALNLAHKMINQGEKQ